MKTLILCLFIILVFLASVPEIRAQTYPMLSCFYECKDKEHRRGAWGEVTTLTLVNQSNSAVVANILFFDGNQNCIATAQNYLHWVDLDEINVCETLNKGGIEPPRAGVIQVRLGESGGWDPTLVSGWVNYFIGTFKKGKPEPFAGTIGSTAKINCEFKNSVWSPGYPPCPSIYLSPILIEDTEDENE